MHKIQEGICCLSYVQFGPSDTGNKQKRGVKTSKKGLEIRAKKVISKLKDMFGKGIEFECTDCFKANETLTGISIQLPHPFAALVIYMEDMPEDASVDEIANICAVKICAGIFLPARFLSDFSI